jgi:hypothetical protein
MATQQLANTTGAFGEGVGGNIAPPVNPNWSFEFFDSMNLQTTALNLSYVTAGAGINTNGQYGSLAVAANVTVTASAAGIPGPVMSLKLPSAAGTGVGFLIDSVAAAPATLGSPYYGGAGTPQVDVFPCGRVMRTGFVLAFSTNAVTATHIMTFSTATGGEITDSGLVAGQTAADPPAGNIAGICLVTNAVSSTAVGGALAGNTVYACWLKILIS